MAIKKTHNCHNWLLPLAILILVFAFGNYLFKKDHKQTFLDRLLKADEPTSKPVYNPPTQSSANEKLDKSPEMQAKRKAFIDKLISKGIIYKIEVPAELPHIYVAPAFYALNFDAKESFINTIYTYYYAQDPNVGYAILYDSKSGKEIGDFSERGLSLK